MIFFFKNMMKNTQIEQLEAQGCHCDDWSRISISEKTDLRKIRNVTFRGDVSIGAGAEIINVPGGLCDISIGDNVRIENVARISSSGEAVFGIGTDIDVLDETGHSVVRMYPGISAQIAAICARMPEYARETLLPLIDAHIASMDRDVPDIGDNVTVRDCGVITDVRIGSGVRVEGAVRLRNGSVVGNARSGKQAAYVGHGVDAENFIIEDAEVKGGCLLRNTYAGQGVILDKGFTSHDSLFFANCNMENGEACAVLAGPYTVSMHKSSLLIGCQTSFMNAGSGTNMSNHMYKLGPAHWGVLERGVKTASNSYLMHGSRIGAYSLVMGEHKTHPDTSALPFSYLFGDGAGKTTVVPGAMLKSFGLKRDIEKWPVRDRRKDFDIPLHDRINFSLLNPATAGDILRALQVIGEAQTAAADDDGSVAWHGLTMSRKSMLNGRELYDMALCRYIDLTTLIQDEDARADSDKAGDRWVDLAGQVLPAECLKRIMTSGSIIEMERGLSEAYSRYDMLQSIWIRTNLGNYLDDQDSVKKKSAALARLVDNDRITSIDTLARHQEMLALL